MITFFKNITTTGGYAAEATWAEVCSSLDVREGKDGHLYHPAVFSSDPPRRRGADITGANALVLDIDNDAESADLSPSDVLAKLHGFKCYWHSTHSNAEDKPKFRFVLPLSRTATPKEFSKAWDGVFTLLGKNLNIDTSCKEIARAYYCPSCPPGLESVAFHGSAEGLLACPELLGEFAQPEAPTPAPLLTQRDEELDLTEVDDCLEFVSPDCGYEQWRNIGMALKSEYGESGFTLWDRWSSPGASYPGSTKLLKFWNSFANTGITLASLVHYAQEAGWVRTSNYEPDFEDGILLQGGNLWPFDEKDPRSKKQKEEKTGRVLAAPGLVGRLATWVNATSRSPQPQLALAASISAVGVLMGHRYRTETDLRSNMLVLGVAPSGAGKDHARKCISKLFSAAGCEDLLGGGNVSSGAAIVSSLKKTGRKLYMMDEIGIKLQAFTAAGAASHQVDVLATAMEMFSSANSLYLGTEYANQAERPRVDIDQPCMCLYGTTVPSRFYDALTSKEAADGFIPRFLVFTSKVRSPKENANPESNEVPLLLLEEVKQILEDKTTGFSEVGTKKIPFSQRARELFAEFKAFCRDEGDKEYYAHSGLDAIWTRACEHAYKLSLLCKEGDEIDATVAKWSIEIVKQQIDEIMHELKGNLSSNAFEKTSKTILRFIENGDGWVSASSIARANQSMKSKERAECLTNLVEGGVIESKSEKGKGRPTVYYKVV